MRYPEILQGQYLQVLKRFPQTDTKLLRGIEKDEVVQAAAAIAFNAEDIFIRLLIVAPWGFRQGWGSAMLREIVAESYNCGYGGAVTLSSVPEAIAFYQRFGFRLLKPPRENKDTPMRLTKTNAALYFPPVCLK